MKPSILNEQLYQRLGLLYESNYIASQLTDDPSLGQLDALAFIEGKDACWQALSTSKIKNKKSLILTSWYFRYLDQDTRAAFIQFFSDLINENFDIYVPEDDHLVKMTRESLLQNNLLDFKPITTVTARNLVATQQLSHDHIDIINLSRLHELAKILQENDIKPYSNQIDILFSDNYPTLALDLYSNPQQIQEIEDFIDPNDKMHYELDANLNLLFRSKLPKQIYSLSISGDVVINDESLEKIHALCPTIEEVSIQCSPNLTTEQLSTIIDKAPNLTTIIFGNVDREKNQFYMEQNVTSLHVPKQLPHLTTLGLSNSNITIEELANLLNKTPNLTQLDLGRCNILGLTELNLSGPLSHLTWLDVSGSSITAEQFTSLLSRSPNLTMLGICNCEELASVLTNLSKEQLSHMKELALSAIDLSTEQLTAIMTKAPNLTRISISGCSWQDNHPFALSEQLSNLTELIASNPSHYNKQLTVEQLTSIISKAPKIRKIDLSGYINLGMMPFNLQEQLDHLTELNMSDSSITVKQLTSIINKAPNLTKLELDFRSKEMGSVLPNLLRQLNHLRELSISSADLTIEQFAAILTQAPHLTRLITSHLNWSHSAPFNWPEPFNNLTELQMTRSNLTTEQLTSIFAKTPKLSKMNISCCQISDSEPLMLSEELSQLKELDASQASLTAEQLNSILIKAPHLTRLKLVYCNKLGSSPLDLPKPFNYLIELDVSMASLTVEQFVSILKRAPNLTTINMKSCDEGFVSALLNLPGQLNHLIELNVDDISEDQLIALRLKAPNLIKIDIDDPTENTDIDLTERIMSDVDLNAAFKINSPSSPETTPPKSQIKKEGQAPDGKLSCDDKDLKARQIFISHNGSNPFAGHYHLQSYHWEDKGVLKENSPVHLETIPLPMYASLAAVETAFADNTAYDSEHHFYGQMKLNALNPGQWYQLPALSTVDQMLVYSTDFNHCEVKRDAYSGYYYLKVDQAVSSGYINYIIESKPNPLTPTSNALPEIQALIATLQFSEEEKLSPEEAYRQLLLYPKNELIKALTTFCHFPIAQGPDISGTPFELLNQLINIRTGACRHRAMLFVALAAALHLDANYVINDLHAFVVVFDESHQAQTIDLGGAPSNYSEMAMEHLTLPSDNPFQTWNSLPLQASDMPALAKELQAPDHLPSRHLIIMENGLAIEALHEAALDSNGLGFFTPNLDTMSLNTINANTTDHAATTPVVTKDKETYHIVDSSLAAFIKEAQDHPQQAMTWFINWSEPKPEHVGLNSIIDDVGRRLGHLQLPDNLHIVVVMDKTSAATMGEDFYSRFDAISQATHLDATVTMQPETETSATVGPHDTFLATAYDWSKELLGSYSIDGQNIVFMPGALIKAINDQSTTLNIHNAPWENPEFCWFMAELIKTRRFFANGIWQTLDAHLQINCVKPLFDYPWLEKPSTSAQEYILNPMTYGQFFPHYHVSKTDGIQNCPGFLKSSTALRLMITDDLSEPQWYKLWQQADEHDCKIELHCAPNVTVPDALKPWVVETALLQPQAPIALIVSNDLDYAEEQYPDALHIPVNLNTRFEALFCHIHRQEQGFSSEETALLQAIREKKAIVFKGPFSSELAQRMKTLFTNNPSLYINGENIPIQSPIVLITNDPTPFANIAHQTISYEPDQDIQRLDEALQTQLTACYQSLNITPCHSHFMDLPEDKGLHERWVATKIQQFQWAAGKTTHPDQATSPENVLDFLSEHPFVFLLSGTGAGKSYFVQHVLPEFGKSHGLHISLHHGLDSLKAWAEADDDAFLFIDEANLLAEHFNLFDNIARGEKTLWIDGQYYPLSPKHKIIFAGNPKQYAGRFEADLFKRFPHYLEFKGQGLETILNPLLQCFDDKTMLLPMIETYYQKAIEAGLNITPRNAQMMCLTAFILKQLPLTQHMSEAFLIQYAALHEIQSLTTDEALLQSFDKPTQSDELDQALASQLPLLESTDFIMTDSRKKIALTLQTLLNIRNYKISNNIEPSAGINGVVIEGEPGLGKSRILMALLDAQHVPYVNITTGNPEVMRKQLLEAFHEGKVAIIDELNSFPDEQLLNAILSGTDLEGHPAAIPGVCLFATQNPITYAGRQPLSKALLNRLITLNLNHYSPVELQCILEQRFKLSAKTAKQVTTQFTQALDYAETQKFFPKPNTRTIFKRAEQLEKKSDTTKEPPNTLK